VCHQAGTGHNSFDVSPHAGEKGSLVRNRSICGIAMIVIACMFISSAATAGTVTVTPDMVPPGDENQPRIVANAPVGFGPDSWQNSATGKVNLYVTPQALFGTSVTIGQVASISYWTKNSVGSENWYVNIYTPGPGDSWYGKRFFAESNIGDDATTADWQPNTVDGMTRTSGSPQTTQTFSDWRTSYSAEVIASFSPQTNSGLNGSDGQIDGMKITLTDGRSGIVDFAAVAPVPLPAALPAGLALFGLVAAKRKFAKRKLA
jgi:hypothetical protein